MRATPPIRTPDQRLRVFVSSTLGELADERRAAREAIEDLRLVPVLFELGARPHPPRELYRAYLEQSHVFVGLYWQRYGWVAPGEDISGLEDEYLLAGDRPRLLYLKQPADREPRLEALVDRFRSDDRASYRAFSTPEELAELLRTDLAVLLSERFELGSTTRPEPTTTLPLPLTPTLGRDEEVDELTGALGSGARLATVTGPGGVGKTRLALEVAGRLQAQGAPVTMVGLSTVRDRDLLVPAVAERVGAHTEGTIELVDAVAAVLTGSGTVLVLDNLEQIDGAGTAVLSLLQAVPDLRVVATSRRPLRVEGEHEVRLGPLAPATAGVDLYAARAGAVAPWFHLDEATRPAVEELVRRVDGMPLAIELAAARAAVLTPEQTLDRLDRRLDLEGGAERPERQRTLRSTIAWSHDLLTEGSRAVLRRLSAFAGGWELAAAEAVAAAPPPGGGEPIDGPGALAELLDHSLIQVAAEPGQAPRFEMLETIRRFAQDDLEASGEAAEARRRHLDWYLAVGEEAQPHLCGDGQAAWVRRLDPERANLRAAVATALASGDPEAVIELTWDVVVLYFVRDAVHEPDDWLGRVAAAQPDLAEVPRAKLRSLRALTRIHHGDREGAWEALTWSLDVFRTHGMDFEAAVTLKEVAFLRFDGGDPEGAIADLEESSRLFAGLDHHWGVALDQTMLGTVLAAKGELDAAEAHHRSALHHARLIDNRPLESQALCQLALLRIWRDEHDRSLELLEEAAGLVRDGRFRVDAAACLDALAGVALARQHPEVARAALARARREREDLGVVLWPTVAQFVDTLWAMAEPGAPIGDDGEEDVFTSLEAALHALAA